MTISLTTIGQPLIEPVFQCLICEGDITGVSSNGAVARCCVLMQGKYIYTFKIYIFRILHRNRAQKIVQCHDKNIWKQICITKLSYSTETYIQSNVQGLKKVKKYMWALHHELVIFLQSRNFSLCTKEWYLRGNLGLDYI